MFEDFENPTYARYIRVYAVVDGPFEEPDKNGNYPLKVRVSYDEGQTQEEKTYNFDEFNQAMEFKNYLENELPTEVQNALVNSQQTKEELIEHIAMLKEMIENNNYYIVVGEILEDDDYADENKTDEDDENWANVAPTAKAPKTLQ